LTVSLESNRCWVIAHRGAPRRYPENTLAGFDQALRAGCDGIEFDVQMSRDGVPVVYHDRTLARAGGERRRVHQLDLRELKRLDAGTRFSGARRLHRIPTLDEVLDRLDGRTRLLVEIKTREGAGAGERYRELATKVARKVHGVGRVWILGFDSNVLATVGGVAPGLPRVLNVRPLLPGLAAKLRRATPSVVNADVRGLSAEFGRRVRRGGRSLWSFTCNTPGQVRNARDAGAEAIISDRADWLAAELGRKS
jgi:glycerophosphoryl diester phosphodiesterase